MPSGGDTPNHFTTAQSPLHKLFSLSFLPYFLFSLFLFSFSSKSKHEADAAESSVDTQPACVYKDRTAVRRDEPDSGFVFIVRVCLM